MAQLNVSSVLLSPKFASRFTVVRRAQNVNNYGEPIITEQLLPGIVGVVTSPGPNELKRLPDFEQTQNTISVITKFALRSASQTNPAADYQPDLIEWNGARYLVFHADDYTQYGAGFVQSLCVETAFTSKAP